MFIFRFGAKVLAPLKTAFSRPKMDYNLSDKIQIIFPEQQLCLCRSNKNLQRHSFLGNKSTFTFKRSQFFIAYRHSVNDLDHISHYIDSAIYSQRLHRILSSHENIQTAISVCVQNESTSKKLVSRCLCIYSNDTNVDESSIRQNLEDFKDCVVMKVCEKDSHYEVGQKSALGAECNEWSTILFHREVDHEQISPIISEGDLSPVFHTYQRSLNILRKCQSLGIKEAEEILGICDKHIPQNFNLTEMRKGMRHPFIVVEGLDATGKTTLTQTLESKLSAERYYTPPSQIQHLRKFFDALPELVRRAYYSVGNYIVAMEISKTCQEKPVIMDRYWHSTAAYGIANETSCSDIPQNGHMVYNWPTDLLTPDLVFFLSVSEDIRKERLKGRTTQEITQEEKNLDRDVMFRSSCAVVQYQPLPQCSVYFYSPEFPPNRLCDAYRRMVNPSCVEIDASGSVDSVVKLAEMELKNKGITDLR